MKRLLLSALFGFFVCSVYGQLHVSAKSRADYKWNEDKDSWDLESKDNESISFFEFNEDFSMVKHTTEGGVSGYLINSQEHDEEDDNNQYIFDIVSDAGNKYLMIYDIKNKNIRFLTGEYTLIQFEIKNVWTDE